MHDDKRGEKPRRKNAVGFWGKADFGHAFELTGNCRFFAAEGAAAMEK